MNVTISLNVVFQVVVILAIGSIIYWVWAITKVVDELMKFKTGLIAHAKAVPSRVDIDKLIPQWWARYEELAEDTPKWTAYKNRLIEVGAMDADGHKIEPGAQKRAAKG